MFLSLGRTSKSKDAGEIQESFDSVLRAIAQDDGSAGIA
jgi:hypothetical protein